MGQGRKNKADRITVSGLHDSHGTGPSIPIRQEKQNRQEQEGVKGKK